MMKSHARIRFASIWFSSIVFVFAAILIYVFPVPALALSIPDDIPYILVDSKTGLVIAEQHADMRLRPASTTKIMTAIIALESGNLDQEMVVSQQAVYDIGRGGMNVGIMAGERGLTLENMLYVMMIKSANEAANIIAENVAPGRAEFIDMMNRKAAELGAVNTNFVNPSGKDTEKEDAAHLSTPRDMAKIARYAMTIPKFREIVSTEYYKDMPVTNKHDEWGILRNTNQFLWYDNTYPYMLEGEEYKYEVIGIKTGYTAEAGNNLITAAVGKDGMELIAVVMHVMQPNRIYGYSKQLLRYGFEKCSVKTVARAGDIVDRIIVDGAAPEENLLPLVTETDFKCTLPSGADIQDIESREYVDENIKAPVKKGDILGYVEYKYNGTALGKVNLTAFRTVEAAPVDASGNPGLSAYNEQPYSGILMCILLAASGFIILRTILRRISRRVNRRKRRQKSWK
jgi:D-alanyl-D-alanine carboxypeptidase (penicillin-binding protein 5/6)